MPNTNPTRILLGAIAGAHGIRGEVTIKSFAADPADIGGYGALSDKTGQKTFVLSNVRVQGKGIVARVAGVADRTAAEALRGTELYVAREKLPAADDGQFYHADLIGCAAVDAAGAVIGEIVAVANYGAGDLLEIAVAGARQTELVPFTDACVPEVDIARRRVVVVMPAMVGEPEPHDDGQDPAS